MNTNLQDAITSMEKVREDKLQELREVESVLAKLKGVVVLAPEGSSLPEHREFVGMGGAEAARALIKAVGKPLSTRDMVDMMIERGWRTRSKNPVASMHATLNQAPNEWKRNASGEWVYVGKR
jgi:hypothetical protein